MKSTEHARSPGFGSASTQARTGAWFRLERTTGGTRLSLVDRKGSPAEADYRRYTGVQREAVRAFAVRLRHDAGLIAWRDDHDAGTAGCLTDPDPRLLDLATAAGMLVDASYLPLSAGGEEQRLALRVRRAEGDVFSTAAHLELPEEPQGDEPAPVQPPSGGKKRTAPLYAVSPCHVVGGRRLLRVRDLGPEWFRDGELAQSRITREELAPFLSFALSHLPGIELDVEGYSVVAAPERVTVPALIFSEIDEYGYLHIRAVSTLSDLPPGFLDNHEITRVALFDEEEREIRVSDILFTSDPAAELRSLLSRMGKETAIFEEQGRFILAPEVAERFLSEHMSTLISSFALYESGKLSRFKIKPVRPRLRLRLSSGIDFLEGSAEVEIEGETFPYARFLDEYRERSYITMSNGIRAFPEPRAIARLKRLIRLTDGEEERVEVSFFDFPAFLRSEQIEVEGEGWKRPEAFYRGYNEIANRDGRFVVEGSDLRPYQEYGVKWLDYLRAHGFGGCLADEMGLGKTVQTIALLRRVYAEGERSPSLVVVPKSLLYNWLEEFRRFAPELSVALWYGSARDGSSEAQIVITSYAIMRLDVALLSSTTYCYVVLDESQSIKNLETKTAQAALSLAAEHKLALSGTPVENSLDELYSLFGFLNKGMFGTASEFLSTYVRPIKEQGDEEALHDLRARIYPFVLRRTKRDVLPDLPEKNEQVAFVELDPDHLAAYDRRRAELSAKVGRAIESDGVAKSIFIVLQALTELRRLASVPEAEGVPISVSAKRQYLREIVPEITENGHKCLIFANYLAAVELVSEDLASLGIGNLVMTGATTDRATLVNRFQNDPEIKALIMTLKTGGVGLNLTAADYVFIFDPWWNRSAETQAIDRTHRIGQRNPVFAYRMIAKGTIEEKILLLQERKAELVSALIASDADAYKSLDEGDVDYLLR